MKKLLSFFWLITLASLNIHALLNAQIKDLDGNLYEVVKIGNQQWLKQNLKSTHFPDGNPIAKSQYVAYNHDSALVKKHGYLYTRSATLYNGFGSKIQGLCPDGWRIPNFNDWFDLAVYLKADTSLFSQYEIIHNIGRNIIDTCWITTFPPPNNDSGLSILPSGVYDSKTKLFTNIDWGTVYFWLTPEPRNGALEIEVTFIKFLKWSDNLDSKFFPIRCINATSTNTSSASSEFPVLNILPNPASTYVEIDTKINLDKVYLINSLGQEFPIHTTGNNRFSIIDMLSGYYWVKIYSEGKIYFAPFVKL
ncbi:MAG: T9SS type A sorting domain-containing protein [Saprospiraceae bacterium]|nr:T9SS type A sorting domain-containing protein [Candidatus Vicinibacter proximus]MBL7824516.1 T9SS type A sorting domain-containing protein [Saprospiraceae bacterium]MCC6842761.1 T9SS type A sorting domain-containing protein [Saprospiraceae bacterium]HRG33523.1 FISUMP domain-containing protein [Saprospiraceae bacterium]